MAPTFFEKPEVFRRWLSKHHASRSELLVGFRKSGSGRPSISWPESVEEALCYGWIDGVRRRVDEDTYTVRFTPRKAGSPWSAVNLRKADALIRAERMQPAGLAAFEVRRARAGGHYSYEQRPEALPKPYAAILKKNTAAARFFTGCAPSYRRAAIWWVVSARQESTRQRRLVTLLEHAARQQLLPQFTRRPAKAQSEQLTPAGAPVGAPRR